MLAQSRGSEPAAWSRPARSRQGAARGQVPCPSLVVGTCNVRSGFCSDKMLEHLFLPRSVTGATMMAAARPASPPRSPAWELGTWRKAISDTVRLVAPAGPTPPSTHVLRLPGPAPCQPALLPASPCPPSPTLVPAGFLQSPCQLTKGPWSSGHQILPLLTPLQAPTTPHASCFNSATSQASWPPLSLPTARVLSPEPHPPLFPTTGPYAPQGCSPLAIPGECQQAEPQG